MLSVCGPQWGPQAECRRPWQSETAQGTEENFCSFASHLWNDLRMGSLAKWEPKRREKQHEREIMFLRKQIEDLIVPINLFDQCNVFVILCWVSILKLWIDVLKGNV